MIYVEKGKEQEGFIAFIEQALEILSREDYTSFLTLFDSSRVTEQGLLLALRYLDETCPITKIDNPLAIKCDERQICVMPFGDGKGYHIDYDLTTDGKINDLTIQIDFIRAGERYSVVLEDLHTL